MNKDDRSTPGRQLLFFDQRSTTRLLEVYVKRSLSLNDARALRKQHLKSRKWVTLTNGGGQARRASSDSSTHRLSIENILKNTESPNKTQPSFLSSGRSKEDVEQKSQKTPETPRKSFLRAFLQWFSRKGTKTKVETPPVTTETSVSDCRVQGKKLTSEKFKERRDLSLSVKKKHSLRKLSFRKVERSESQKKPSSLTAEDVVRLPHAVSVEPTSVYFENVSEELERIVKEVENNPEGDMAAEEQGCPPDDTVERIVSLMKEHGDAIDEKIRRNSSMSLFFQRLTYTSFQQLADRYLSGLPRPLERVTHAAPELVQLAFTLHLTANVARFSSQGVSRIMGFGNQYLYERFTQISSAHTQMGDDEGQCSSDPE